MRPFLDTLPFAGRLSGHTVAHGPLSELALEVEWTFRDSLVPDWPETRIRGTGEVNLTAADGIRFRSFAMEDAAVDLGTVRRLVPGFALLGVLDAAGTLDGPWNNAQFSGTLRHRDGGRPASLVRGDVRLDSRGDTLGVFATVVADSLAFEGLKGSFPGLPLVGVASGPVRLEGSLAALEAHADLAVTDRAGGGQGGRVSGDGVLLLVPPQYGVRDLTMRARDVDLEHWLDGAPSSRLTFAVSGTVILDSAADVPPAGAVAALLRPSLLAGAVLDSGGAHVRFANGKVYLDSLRLSQPGLITTGSGSLGWARPARGRLTLDLDADSLSVLDSLAGWLAGAEGGAGPAFAGAARALVTFEGSLDSLAVEARLSGRNVAWEQWRVPAGRARVTYRAGPVPEFSVDATLDSLGYGRLGFGAAAAAARGTRDSVSWFARSRLGDLGAFLAGGRFAWSSSAGSAQAAVLRVDSLAVLLPGGVWALEAPADLVVGDSVATVRGFTVQRVAGPGRLVLTGDLPTRGRANASLQVEGFPLAGLYALLQYDTLGVGGTVSATLGVAGSRAQPVYQGSIALSDGTFGEFRAPFMDGTLEYRERQLDAALHLRRAEQQILNVTAHLPLDLSLVPVARRQLPDTLSVRAVADSVDLSVLEALTPALQRVRGEISADVGIRGTWDFPRLRGHVDIAGAAATIPALNVRYENMHGRLTLSGDTIRIDSLSARGEKGEGRAAVSGVIRLDRLTRPVLDLTIVADEFKALDLRGYASVTASVRQSLTGPLLGATLTGRGTVTSGVLYFTDLVKKRVVNLDEPWVASLIDRDTALAATIRRQRLGPEFRNVFLDSLRIRDLELAMGSAVWLRSTEANIQLTGTVGVTKERDNYLLSGTLQAPRGTYRLVVVGVTREFVVTQGTVRYFGTPDLDAELDIEAKHVVHPVPTPTQPNPEDLTVAARITGTLLVPRLTLSAEGRELSQTEIISYLLFAQPSSELVGGQGRSTDPNAVLKSAQSALAGIAAGQLERTLVSDLGVPLDYLEIRPGDPTDLLSGARFAAGFQIGRKTFLVLNAGFCQGRQVDVTLGASLQFRLSPEWRTEASFEPVRVCADPTEQQAGTVPRQLGLDLFWEKRY